MDDEEGVRHVLRRIFASAGLSSFQVREASSGEAALELLARETFDLVLTDFRMGGKTGVDVLAWVHEHRRGTKRMLMTGYNEENIAVDSINAGRVECYIKKPWDNDLLVGAVRGLLKERREALLKEQRHETAVRLVKPTQREGALRRL